MQRLLCLLVLLVFPASMHAAEPGADPWATATPPPTANPASYVEPTLAPYPPPGAPKAVCPNGDASYPWIFVGVAPDGTVLWDLDYSRPFCPADAPPTTPPPDVSYDTQRFLPVVLR
jgi:hypothetical protein